MESLVNSPFIVPLGAFLVAIVAIISGAASRAHSQKLKAEQRMALLARGVPLSEIEGFLSAGHEVEEKLPTTPTRRMGNSRRSAIVLTSVGIGIAIFGLALTWIVQERDVLVVAASGLIPLAIGIGFFADYKLQREEVEKAQYDLQAEKAVR